MDNVIAEINRCNQRSERMLSVVDLLNSGTCSAEAAAYIAEGVNSGASFLVCAKPSGGGKTTVMAAFLAFVPRDTGIIPAESVSAMKKAFDSGFKTCLLCHEIGSGGFYAYLWGEEARFFFSSARRGQIAANLHADTIEEAEESLLEKNGVRKEDLDAVRFLIFLEQGERGEKKFSAVYESTSGARQKLPSAPGLDSRRERFRKFLLGAQKRNITLIEDVRTEFLEEFYP